MQLLKLDITFDEWKKLTALMSAQLMFLTITMLLIFFSDISPKLLSIKQQHTALADNVRQESHRIFWSNVEQRVASHLDNPLMQSMALKKLLRLEIKTLLDKKSNNEAHLAYSEEQRQAAFDSAKARMEQAISSGKWDNTEARYIAENAHLFSPEQKLELLEIYHRALNEQVFEHDPHTVPPPL